MRICALLFLFWFCILQANAAGLEVTVVVNYTVVSNPNITFYCRPIDQYSVVGNWTNGWQQINSGENKFVGTSGAALVQLQIRCTRHVNNIPLTDYFRLYSQQQSGYSATGVCLPYDPDINCSANVNQKTNTIVYTIVYTPEKKHFL